MIIKTNKNQILDNSSHISLETISINFVSSTSIFIISDEELTNYEIKFKKEIDKNFLFYKVDGGSISESREILQDDFHLDYWKVKNKHVYRFELKFITDSIDSDTQFFKEDLIINLETSKEVINYDIPISCEVIGPSDKLIVTLQNLKKYIDEDYMTAFRETDVKSKDIDYIIYNKKIKEYLLNIHDLSTLHGSYKNLFSVLKYFGYGDLLMLKEYWVDNDNKYKSTSIYNVVLEYLDKSLIGFKKTNMMSLVYQINEETGVDDDGLPLYIKVFSETDEILIKLNALKKILERDFLHFNTHIVDIIGEFQTVVVQELNLLSNLSLTSTINISDNLNKRSEIYLNTENITIETNSAFVQGLKIKEIGDDIDFNNYNIEYDKLDFFNIIKRYNDEDIDDFDVLTKLYTDTFGILELFIDFDLGRYQKYQIVFVDPDTKETIYESGYLSTKNIKSDALLIGIRKEGKYNVLVNLIDHYNNITVCGINEVIEVEEPKIDIFLGQFLEIIPENQKVKLFDEWSTFETDEEDAFLVPSFDSDLNINTWDPELNFPELKISKKFSKTYDQIAVYSSVNQLNSIPLDFLTNIPLYSWGSTYCVGIIDIIGDENQEGERSIIFKNINDFEDEVISKHWIPGENKIEWLSKFLQDIKDISIDENIFNDFNFGITYYLNTSEPELDDITNARPMIQFKSKEASYKSRILNVSIISPSTNDFLESYFVSDELMFSYEKARLLFGKIEDNSEDILTVYLDEEEVLSKKYDGTLEGLKNIIENDQKTKNIVTVIGIDSEKIHILADRDITLKSKNYGIVSDIVRGKHFKFMKELKRGTSIKVGQPIICSISNKSRYSISHVKWTLIDELTNKKITEQKSLVLKYILSKESTYSVELEYVMNGTFRKERLSGSILCSII